MLQKATCSFVAFVSSWRGEVPVKSRVVAGGDDINAATQQITALPSYLKNHPTLRYILYCSVVAIWSDATKLQMLHCSFVASDRQRRRNRQRRYRQRLAAGEIVLSIAIVPAVIKALLWRGLNDEVLY
jgi:anaerobic C4-dicarboxylate transporter